MPKTQSTECDSTMESKKIPDHTHTCIGRHHEDTDHYCGECQRFWREALPA